MASDADIDAVLRMGAVRRTVTLRAPAVGTVTGVTVIRGQRVEAGMPLYIITDLGDVWIMAEVREADAGTMRPDLGADIEVPALPGRTIKGRVTLLDPILASSTRALRAHRRRQ